MSTEEIQGVIAVDKPSGVTSHDIVNKMRRLYGTKKIGHTGTLDPMATGVLVVLIGRAAKASEYLLSDGKIYDATLRLGMTSTTEDTQGEILTECNDIPCESDVLCAIESFKGDIMQTPPMYSALKVNGQKLVDLARRGIQIQREQRQITIYGIQGKRITDREYSMTVSCSKGTYIRTLCADIGATLKCGAVMSSLRRIKSGAFTLDNCYTVQDIEEMTLQERIDALLPTEQVFSEYPVYKPSGFFLRLCRDGQQLYQSKIKTDFPLDSYVRLYDEDGFFALGQVQTFEEGSAIKPVKVFKLK